MKQIFILIFLLLTSILNAQILISPIDAMRTVYGLDSEVSKTNILLSKAQASKIEQDAQVKLDTNIFRYYKATKADKILGYAILVNNKVRSKNAVVLYFITTDAVLKGIEIIAFNEPLEYIPSATWNSQFQDIPTTKMLRLSKEIPTITGATLSARSITDSSRVAFAFFNEILKEK